MSAPIVHHSLSVSQRSAELFEAGNRSSQRTVLLLPSMLIRARSYRRTILALASRGFRVITIEVPGSGAGSHLDRSWSFEDYADWIESFMATCNPKRPTVIGHSASAPPAMIVAARRAELFGGLVLCGSVGLDRSHSLVRLASARAIDLPLEPGLSASAAADVAFNMVRHTCNFFRQIWNCAQADLWAVASQVRVPTLLAWGARDHTVSLGQAGLFCRKLPSGQLHISREGSHDWLVERAGEFSQMTEQFALHHAMRPTAGSLRV